MVGEGELIVEVLAWPQGFESVYDPACRSGGMLRERAECWPLGSVLCQWWSRNKLGRKMGLGAMVISISGEQRRQLRDVWAYQGAVRGFRLVALSLSTIGLMLASAALGLRGKSLALFFGAAFVFMLVGAVLMLLSSAALTAHMIKVLKGNEMTPFERASLLRGMVLSDAFSIRRGATHPGDQAAG
jgi:hypothetical protein